jgi:carbonic anhydrase
MEGVQYPLEIHFVHVNMLYNNGNINSALASGSPDALLVVGQMFAVGVQQSSAMDTIAQGILAGDVSKDRPLVLADLMDTTHGYYTYPGSLTTPTCNPVVTWVVLASVLHISPATMDAFLGISNGALKISEHGNYRNLQPLGDRMVYR